MNVKVKLALPLACLLLGATVAAEASPYVVTMQEVGPNVVATGSGAIDFAGLTLAAAVPGSGAVEPDNAYLVIGGGMISAYRTQSYTGPHSFGSGGFTQANSQL